MTSPGQIANWHGWHDENEATAAADDGTINGLRAEAWELAVVARARAAALAADSDRLFAGIRQDGGA